MSKGVISILMGRTPPPEKHGVSVHEYDPNAPMENEGEKGEQGDGAEEGDEEGGDQAARESAMDDFISAVRHGKSADALSAFRELMDLCGDSEKY